MYLVSLLTTYAIAPIYRLPLTHTPLSLNHRQSAARHIEQPLNLDYGPLTQCGATSLEQSPSNELDASLPSDGRGSSLSGIHRRMSIPVRYLRLCPCVYYLLMRLDANNVEATACIPCRRADAVCWRIRERGEQRLCHASLFSDAAGHSYVRKARFTTGSRRMHP